MIVHVMSTLGLPIRSVRIVTRLIVPQPCKAMNYQTSGISGTQAIDVWPADLDNNASPPSDHCRAAALRVLRLLLCSGQQTDHNHQIKPAYLETNLKLLRGNVIVHIANIDRPRINCFLLLKLLDAYGGHGEPAFPFRCLLHDGCH